MRLAYVRVQTSRDFGGWGRLRCRRERNRRDVGVQPVAERTAAAGRDSVRRAATCPVVARVNGDSLKSRPVALLLLAH